MAGTRKQPAKRRKSSKKKPKQQSWLGWLLLVAAIVVLGGGIYWFRDHLPPVHFEQTAGLERSEVDTVLLAAGADLAQDRQIIEKDGVERWKVQLDSVDILSSVINALDYQIKNRSLEWKPSGAVVRDGERVQLLDIPVVGKPLRLILVAPEPKKRKAPKPKPAIAANKPTTQPDTKPEPPPVVPKEKTEGPMIAIILDDVGQKEVAHLKPVLDLGYPITFAVIPFLPYSASNAISLNRAEYEIILHMPMEPGNYPTADPGEGAIFTTFSDTKVREAVAKAIENVPLIKGVNNHMGSKITTSRPHMVSALSEIRKHDLYYIDSRTNANTVAHKVALEMGMPTARRDVFLDSEMSYEFAVKQLAQARAVADRQGVAVVIGHPYDTSLSALRDEMPKLAKAGYRFVFASEIVRRANGRL